MADESLDPELEAMAEDFLEAACHKRKHAADDHDGDGPEIKRVKNHDFEDETLTQKFAFKDKHGF